MLGRKNVKCPLSPQQVELKNGSLLMTLLSDYLEYPLHTG